MAANPGLIRTVCRSVILQCAEVTPVLGMTCSAGKRAMATKQVVADGRNLYTHADAVKTIIKRDLGKHSVDLGTGTNAAMALFKRTQMDPLPDIASRAIDASSLQLDAAREKEAALTRGRARARLPFRPCRAA